MTTQTTNNSFGSRLFISMLMALAVAKETADANGSPVMIMRRDGWLAICEEAPDDAECDPYGHGWTDVALVEPVL